ncbi:hypothetical protein GCM10010174_19910 [Kutzneria viridogrisea]|uniref:3-keto-alpha-glucoside-1,2-lyase/3-keto-2-hydroxy-glucal hydratase domain-containing protein n=2 Tax=Kutzneria TaxID=43356 RepID=W5WES6_9PSEU|nr:family 16 glycoside hydrolase [Kutzneria albida]AHH99352.1 hypothetical protein KALB_5992 [Kutzneria albida DSM 43870]MBA8923093.1 hypothetical protein [Kutzneria viridogrisea]
MRAVRTAVLAGVLVCASACGEPDFQSWAESSVHGGWQSVFTGHGSTGVDSAGTLIVSPTPPSGSDTHAALIVSTADYTTVDITVRVRTTAQLRSGQPNPWEVGWVLWHYADPTHFYYVTLKPNGWEVGKEDPAYPGNQRFLATGARGFTVGEWHEVHVKQSGTTITVSADGTELGTVTDTDTPYRRGKVGLYTEDATVQFRPTSLCCPD